MNGSLAATLLLIFSSQGIRHPPRAPLRPARPAGVGVFLDGNVQVAPPGSLDAAATGHLVDVLSAALSQAGYRVVTDKRQPHAFGTHLVVRTPRTLMLRLKHSGVPFDTLSAEVDLGTTARGPAVRQAVEDLVARMGNPEALATRVRNLPVLVPAATTAAIPAAAATPAAAGGAAPPPAAAAPTAPATLTRPAKLLVMPMKVLGGLPAGHGELVGSLLLAQLDEVAGLSTYSKADLDVILAVEKQKDALGCDSSSCMADLGGALGADEVLYGSVGKLESSYEVSVTVVKAQSNAVVGRLARVVPATDAALTGVVAELARGVVEKLNERSAAGP
jgi:hypothetical protein